MSEIEILPETGGRKHLETLVFRKAVVSVALFLILIWGIKGAESLLDESWAAFGVFPRTWEGVKGIFLAPLLHSNFEHLISNSIPLLVLGIGLFYFYPRIAWEVSFWIYLSTGLWVWLAARGGSYHIGASGVVYGLAAFLIVAGLIRKNLRIMTTSLVVLFLYGGMFYGVLPGTPGISWESHLFGAISGVGMALYFRKEPLWSVTNKPTPIEDEEDEDESPGTPYQGPVAFPYKFVPEQED